ncbi:MAG TPA: hypothetical protein EYP85_07790, partial [Armatimonadetes bacterium]|nr:hypothetical protein [Armatimonadota bacterium]
MPNKLWLSSGILIIIAGGCRSASPPPEVPLPPCVGSGLMSEEPPQPPEFLDAAEECRQRLTEYQRELAEALEHLAQGEKRTLTAQVHRLLTQLSDLHPLLPNGAAQAAVAQAQKALTVADFVAARAAIDEAVQQRENVALYSALVEPLELVLERARDYAQREEAAKAQIELAKAEALLTLTPLEAIQREVTAALQDVLRLLEQGLAEKRPEAVRSRLQVAERHLSRLHLATHVLEAQGHVGRARAEWLHLARSKAKAELGAAQRELAAAAECNRQVEVEWESLQADFDSLTADLSRGAPGVPERLTALWKKLEYLAG